MPKTAHQAYKPAQYARRQPAVPSDRGTVLSFPVGTVLPARDGPVKVQNLQIGHVVICPDRIARRVVWISRSRPPAAMPPPTASPRERCYSRFEHRRFIDGFPADMVFEVLFEDPEERSTARPDPSSGETEAHQAGFRSVRHGDDNDDTFAAG